MFTGISPPLIRAFLFFRESITNEKLESAIATRFCKNLRNAPTSLAKWMCFLAWDRNQLSLFGRALYFQAALCVLMARASKKKSLQDVSGGPLGTLCEAPLAQGPMWYSSGPLHNQRSFAEPIAERRSQYTDERSFAYYTWTMLQARIQRGKSFVLSRLSTSKQVFLSLVMNSPVCAEGENKIERWPSKNIENQRGKRVHGFCFFSQKSGKGLPDLFQESVSKAH